MATPFYPMAMMLRVMLTTPTKTEKKSNQLEDADIWWKFGPTSSRSVVQSVEEGIAAKAMVLDGIISSPHRRTQNPFSSPSFRKPHPRGDELGSCSTLLQRHRFLLTALVLLAFLCTIYLYFAVTLALGWEVFALWTLLLSSWLIVLGYGIKSDKSKLRRLDDHGSA
ncbi:hypothetical protein RJ639_010540 [Escallonia herrerae]|uniref:Uncharacterized protein n=1 Tax=Escallonia herrerae TaxID=1293975 RepID=A0AA89APG2_9ASTE|nr:hypothetical protein RJ639_010540 [Escallonia herrerae]